MAFDRNKLLEETGGWSWYQTISYFGLTFVVCFAGASQFLALKYEDYIPDVIRCDVNETLWVMTDFNETDHCVHYVSTSSKDTTKCTSWTYSSKAALTSIITDWDIVCDDSPKVAQIQMLTNFSFLVGCFLFGVLGDKFGRQPMMFLSTLGFVVCGTSEALVPYIWLHIVFRCIKAGCVQGLMVLTQTFVSELLPGPQRATALLLLGIMWAFGVMYLTVVAYFLRYWRVLLVAVTAPFVVSLLFYLFIKESLLWLLARNRLAQGEKVLRYITWMNNIPPIEFKYSEWASSDLRPAQVYSVIELFRHKRLAVITCCSMILWATNALVYYGVETNSSSIQGNFYVVNLLQGAVELPAMVLAIILLMVFDRKLPLALLHVGAGVSCVATVFATGIWNTVAAMAAKFFISASFIGVFTIIPECFPTVLRNQGVAICISFGWLWVMVCPLINSLKGVPELGVWGARIPMILFAVICFIAAFCVYPLDETKNRPLAETIDDMINYEDFCQRQLEEKNTTIPKADENKRFTWLERNPESPTGPAPLHTHAEDDEDNTYNIVQENQAKRSIGNKNDEIPAQQVPLQTFRRPSPALTSQPAINAVYFELPPTGSTFAPSN